MDEAAARLGHFAAEFRYENAPPPVVQHAKVVLADTLGAMLGAGALPEFGDWPSQSTYNSGPAATVLPNGRCADMAHAIVANATAGVSLEVDEGNQFCANHPGVHVVAPLLAASEQRSVTGRQFLEALVIGYEIGARLGRAVHLRDEVHPFGTVMAAGAAAAVSRLRRLDQKQTRHALLIAAGTTPASSQTAANAGASVRNLCSGLTAWNGYLAAETAGASFEGEPDAFGRVYGRIIGTSFEPELALADIGNDFYLPKNYFKLHACSRWNHAPIEAAEQVRRMPKFSAAYVAGITVRTYDPATRLDSVPANALGAKHSIPYNVAIRLLRGSNWIDDYTDTLVWDDQVRSLMKTIRVVEDPALTARVPDERGAIVEVTLRSGEKLTGEERRPRGGFDNPCSPEELQRKYMSLSEPRLGEDAANALWTSIMDIEQAPNVGDVVNTLRQT